VGELEPPSLEDASGKISVQEGPRIDLVSTNSEHSERCAHKNNARCNSLAQRTSKAGDETRIEEPSVSDYSAVGAMGWLVVGTLGAEVFLPRISLLRERESVFPYQKNTHCCLSRASSFGSNAED
jgi:hypothetical protein